jgi:hypothetical protein
MKTMENYWKPKKHGNHGKVNMPNYGRPVDFSFND